MLEEAGLPPTALTLEVTESAMMSDPERAIATLAELRTLGCRIAVDDFGTGHASLAYLKRLPVDELKIDKSFVMGLEADRSDRSIVRSTIELAHELGLTAVAEGVETAWVLEWLTSKGCDLAQGFFFSPAVASAEFDRLLRKESRDAPEATPARPAAVGRPIRRPVQLANKPGVAADRAATPVAPRRQAHSNTG
jgi:EAL domain-containing protein (putative c-di-GMP-specific phosphodiesterase class I)